MKQNISLFKRANGVWYILDRTSFKDVWRSTGTSIKADARKVLVTYRTLHPIAGSPSPILSVKTIRLSIFEKEFMEYAMQSYAVGSCNIFQRVFFYLKHIAGDPSLNAINMHILDRYKTERLNALSAVSVNIELRSLRTLMATAVRWGYLEKNPFSGLKLVSVPEKTPRFLEENDFIRLYNAIGQKWLREIVLFAVNTGARRSEVVNLKWSDVDLSRRMVSFESNGGFRVKAGKRRSIPLNDEVLKLLSSIKNSTNCEYVFNLDGHRIDESLVTHKFKKCIRRVGLQDDIKFHSLRATFASWLVMKGAPIYSVSKLLGHSDVTTTQRYYAHLSPDTLHDVVMMISSHIKETQ
jgi:integrase